VDVPLPVAVAVHVRIMPRSQPTGWRGIRATRIRLLDTAA
jgi:hypothetical protein